MGAQRPAKRPQTWRHRTSSPWTSLASCISLSRWKREAPHRPWPTQRVAHLRLREAWWSDKSNWATQSSKNTLWGSTLQIVAAGAERPQSRAQPPPNAVVASTAVMSAARSTQTWERLCTLSLFFSSEPVFRAELWNSNQMMPATLTGQKTNKSAIRSRRQEKMILNEISSLTTRTLWWSLPSLHRARVSLRGH